MKACEKQDLIWNEIKESAYPKDKLPSYQDLGLKQVYSMFRQNLKSKVNVNSDIVEDGWVKYLHRRGSIAKIKIIPLEKNKYTGIFGEGAECGLLRLSLTSKPEEKVATGLALKVFRDNLHSGNVSALYALAGQGMDFNFFKHPMSNIVPSGSGVGEKLVHYIFSKVSKYPEELKVEDLAKYNKKGELLSQVVAPKQIFFVPRQDIKNKFSSTKHDVRKDFFEIPAGTVLYDIYVNNRKDLDSFDFARSYKSKMIQSFVEDSIPVAKIVTTSAFIASSFGDDRILFRHEVHPK